MTRAQFVAMAVKAAERQLGVPPGWWGTWRDVTDGTVRVRWTGQWWRISCAGIEIGRGDSRPNSIARARKMRRS
jgi:hypothetical protein